jgi:hypothetical protein
LSKTKNIPPKAVIFGHFPLRHDIQRLPCMYLLDMDKRVLLKEADYGRLCKYLSENEMLFKR